MPGAVTPPSIITSSVIDNHIPTLFTISVSGFNSSGTATHTATSYVITDIAGNHLWSSLNDESNKDSIWVDDIILQAGSIYLIKASFHASSGDISQFSTKIIHVLQDDIELLGSDYDIDVNAVNILKVKYHCDAASSTWKVYAIEQDGLKLITTLINSPTKPLEVSIPADLLKVDRKYMLAIQIAYNDGSTSSITYKEISTYYTAN
jgi:hypothetical protein